MGKVQNNTQNYWVFGLFPSSGILEVQWLKLAVSKGPNWVGVFSLFTRGRKQIQFPKRRGFYSLEYRTMEKVQKPAILRVVHHRQNRLESTK
jgi:hypothetical protein